MHDLTGKWPENGGCIERCANFLTTFTRQNRYPWKALGTRIPKMSELTDGSGRTETKWQKTMVARRLHSVNGRAWQSGELGGFVSATFEVAGVTRVLSWYWHTALSKATVDGGRKREKEKKEERERERERLWEEKERGG